MSSKKGSISHPVRSTTRSLRGGKPKVESSKAARNKTMQRSGHMLKREAKHERIGTVNNDLL